MDNPIKDDAYRLLFETHPLPMYIADSEDCRFLAVNEAAITHYGYSRDEFLAMTMMDIRPDEDLPEFKEKLGAIPPTSGVKIAGTWRHRKKDGTIIFVEVTHSRIRHEGQDAFLVVINDVTERNRYEAALRQYTKLEAVGRLAGGVAHDFNNMLTIILGYCNITMSQLGESDALRLNIEGIRKAGERAALLTKQMLAFSRRQVLQPKILDLNEIVAETSFMLRRLIGEHIELATTLEKHLSSVKADPGQVEQILMNLMVNARDSMANGGRIVIETHNIVIEPNDSKHEGLKPGNYVLIAVGDNGAGMDETTRLHIFEPFFKTAQGHQATGLGLATVYGIVKQSGGYIYVFSKPGQGTTFEIFMPVAFPEEDLREKVVPPTGNLAGTETILLVEDEGELRKLASNILKRSGYRVLEAVDGEDALIKAAAHAGPIQLMISDLVMPKLGGLELARRLKPVRADTKVIFMSGYASDAIQQHGVLEPDAVYLEKPFSPPALLETVRRILDGHR